MNNMAKKEETTYEKLKDQVDTLTDQVKQAHRQTADFIDDNPLKSTMIALGVGIVAGAVLMKLLDRK